MVRFRFGLKTEEGIDIENKVNDLMKDLPQLIVALDSLDDSANYIHIADANYATTYYCPCCKGVVKPRACKKDVDYQVQPHFYHENGGCSEESFVHYICKTWLFEKGSKFKIKKDNYTVRNIETEKTFHTKFGDYRPDIVVETEEGKKFFFEIKYFSKKNEHYIPKWDELETDVVEVDAREFINQKHSNNVPEFKLIYSDGECFIKKYSNADYEDTIAKRKLEWKRQDKLNYKIQWEKLDWFWNVMQKYKNGEVSEEIVFECFKYLDIFDKEICYDLLKRQSCIRSLNSEFRDIINKESVEYWNGHASKMIQNKIYFSDICSIKPRNSIFIYYHYTDINGYEQSNSIRRDNREWIVRPSKLLKIIDEIKNDISLRNEFIINQKYFDELATKAMSDILKLFSFNGCIWYLITKRSDYLEIGIKNAYSAFHSANVRITYNDFIGSNFNFTYENVYKVLIKKITYEMNNIYNYVAKNDGYDSEYRHLFVSKIETKEEM